MNNSLLVFLAISLVKTLADFGSYKIVSHAKPLKERVKRWPGIDETFLIRNWKVSVQNSRQSLEKASFPPPTVYRNALYSTH